MKANGCREDVVRGLACGQPGRAERLLLVLHPGVDDLGLQIAHIADVRDEDLDLYARDHVGARAEAGAPRRGAACREPARLDVDLDPLVDVDRVGISVDADVRSVVRRLEKGRDLVAGGGGAG